MAKQITVTVVDDIDGTPGASTFQFALEGKSYAIDLSEQNAQALREALAHYIDKARPQNGEDETPEVKDSHSVQYIRSWAQENGYPVSDRGSIPKKVMRAFLKANPA